MSQNPQTKITQVLMASSFAMLTVFALVSFSHQAQAHEGHHAPVKLKSKYGGMVKAGKALDLEYRVQQGELKVWPRAHEGEQLKDVKIAATLTPPRGKSQALPLNWDTATGLAVAKLDFGKSHRLAIEIRLEAMADVNGQLTAIQEQFKFQAEK